MASLEEISLNRITIDIKRLIESYRDDFEALKRTHAAQGKLRSGATIIASINSSKNAFISLRDICIKHLQSLINDSATLTEISLQKIRSEILEMFTQFYAVTFEIMTKSTEIAGKPELRDRYMPDIEKEKNNTLLEVTMFIDGSAISKQNKDIKEEIETKFKTNGAATNSTDVIDIKPNFFGLGININEIFRRVNKWLSK